MLPAYIPAGAYVWQKTSPSQKGANGVGNVLYRLPGQPVKDSPTYPFRIISISEASSSVYANSFPIMSFTTGAHESLRTGFKLDGGSARLYSSFTVRPLTTVGMSSIGYPMELKHLSVRVARAEYLYPSFSR